MNQNDFEKIKNLYKMREDEPLPGHSFENHVLEVFENIKELISDEDVDKKVLEYAALLHDVGRGFKGEKSHAEIGAEKARKFLIEELGRDEKFAEEVSECIKFHSNRPGIEPPTREAEILWTADKMQALGATGIMRMVLSLGAKNFSCKRALEVLKRRTSNAEERFKEFGFDGLVPELHFRKKFIEKYEEEKDASD